MKPGMQLLLEVLRGHPVGEPSETDWADALAEARTQNVSFFFVSQIRAARALLPQTIERQLQALDREAALQTFFWSAELQGVLAGFAREQLRVILLKGLSFAQRVYGAAERRSSRDLDLLVRRSDLAAAERLLQGLGFSSESMGDDYHRTWMRGTTAVELHFNVENPLAFDFHVEAVWTRAVPAGFGGQPAWVLAPEDELLFLCLHGARHRFDRLSLVLDLELMLRHLGTMPRIHSLSAEATQVLDLGCRMAAHLRSAQAVAAKPGLAHLVAMSDRLWCALLNDDPRPVMDWTAQHQFYLELEGSGLGRVLRRIRHGRILVGRLIDDDFRFAGRLGLQRRWQVWMLRPVRLLLARISRG